MDDLSRVKIRRGFFTRIFSRLSELLPEVFAGVQFDDEDAHCLSELYFLLNDSYKIWRVRPEHFTNDYKKAGLTITAIMAMRPMDISQRNEQDLRPYYANQIFALACATAILNLPLSSMPEGDRNQFYAWLDTLRLGSAQNFLDFVVAGGVREPGYTMTLTFDEVSQIDMVVQKIADFAACYDIQARLHNEDQDV